MLVSAKQQCKWVMIIYIYNPSLLSLLPLPNTTPPDHHKTPGWAPCYNAAYHYLPISHMSIQGFPGGTSGKEPASQCRRWQVQSLGQEGALEEGIATCSWYPMDIRAWGGGSTQSLTRLKQLSMREEYICQCCFLNSSYPLSPTVSTRPFKNAVWKYADCHWCTMHARVLSSSVTSDLLWPRGL